MMRPSGDVPVYLMVQDERLLDAYSESLFVFINKARNRIKLLYWEKNGFCLWQKRLEKHRFSWPLKETDVTVELNTQELNWLLDGFDIWRMPPHQRLLYEAVG